MGLFRKRKSLSKRATRKAEAKAIKSKAKLEARLSARNTAKGIKSVERSERKNAKLAAKSAAKSDQTALRIAEHQRKTAEAGKLLSVTRVRRTMALSRLLAPVAVPVIYKAAVTVRGIIDQKRAERFGVPIEELGKFTGHGAALSARIANAGDALGKLVADKPKDAETSRFVESVGERLTHLSHAVETAEHMPATRRKKAHAAISHEIDGIEADLLARFGVS